MPESDERVRVEIRSYVKNLQRQKLMSDSDFVCYAHWARVDDIQHVSDVLEKIKKCRSELDIISHIKKRFLKCRVLLSKAINLDGAAHVL